MSENLPWGGINVTKHQVDDSSVELGLFHVTGPYQLVAYVLARTGQEAILSLTSGPWSKDRVFDDHCQAEYLGQKVIPRLAWNLFLAHLDSPLGLVIQPQIQS